MKRCNLDPIFFENGLLFEQGREWVSKGSWLAWLAEWIFRLMPIKELKTIEQVAQSCPWPAGGPCRQSVTIFALVCQCC
jgi:hypothetical protein